MSTSTLPAATPTSQPDGYPFHIGTRYVPGVDADGNPTITPVPLTEEDFLHPLEGDRFMLNDAHWLAVTYLYSAIQTACRNRPGVHVLGDHRIDWQHEGIRAHGPDLAVFNNFPADWDPYLGTFPVVDQQAETLAVFEATSESTRKVDIGNKFEEFAEVGIPYYLIVDTAEPTGAREIRGYHLSRGRYRAMKSDDALGYFVPGLKMWFRWDADTDRVVAADEDGHDIPNAPELANQLAEERQLAVAERKRADAERKRADDERKRADDERKQTEVERKRADSAENRADELAKELASLRAQLADKNGS